MYPEYAYDASVLESVDVYVYQTCIAQLPMYAWLDPAQDMVDEINSYTNLSNPALKAAIDGVLLPDFIETKLTRLLIHITGSEPIR